LDRLQAVREALAGAADAEPFAALRAQFARAGFPDALLPPLVARVSHGPRDQDEILAVRRRVCGPEAGDEQRLFERYVLLRAAQASVDAVATLPVPDEVRHLLLDEYAWMASPPERELRWLEAGEYVFSALCKLATLRRFPAGQMHWEVAGLPRSVVWQVHPRDLARLLLGIRDLGGLRPTFVPHLAWRRKQIVLSEVEHYRALERMAGAIELQPGIRGFVAVAWFYAPDVARVSPHLAWAPRHFQTWGGTLLAAGRAGEDSGIFEQGRRRRELVERGMKPSLGLAIWPRAAMLRWASQVRATADPTPPDA
jgi:hypothetical protein